jgi:1-deoxyxylulose-5-phosphate synthase
MTIPLRTRYNGRRISQTFLGEALRMSHFDRRSFLATTVGGAAAGVASTGLSPNAASGQDPPATSSAAEGDAPPPPPRITLGNTGVEMTRLGQGTGVHGGNRASDQSRMGFEKLVDLFHHAYDRGLRFFDLADLYGTHLYFREALRKIPRDEVAILTKVWWRYDGPEDDTSAEFRTQMLDSTIERFRHELATDYLDIVLLHCLMDDKWTAEMTPYMEALVRHKEAGRIKAVGVSCHDFGALKTAAAAPWVDVILARVNPKGVLMDASTDEVVAVLRDAKKAGKAIIGMKIFGEGQLADQRDACMKFAQNLEFLDAMTIGFEKPEQIDDVLRLMAKYPAKQQA